MKSNDLQLFGLSVQFPMGPEYRLYHQLCKELSPAEFMGKNAPKFDINLSNLNRKNPALFTFKTVFRGHRKNYSYMFLVLTLYNRHPEPTRCFLWSRISFYQNHIVNCVLLKDLQQKKKKIKS